jgi:hypothetical protein
LYLLELSFNGIENEKYLSKIMKNFDHELLINLIIFVGSLCAFAKCMHYAQAGTTGAMSGPNPRLEAEKALPTL